MPQRDKFKLVVTVEFVLFVVFVVLVDVVVVVLLVVLLAFFLAPTPEEVDAVFSGHANDELFLLALPHTEEFETSK